MILSPPPLFLLLFTLLLCTLLLCRPSGSIGLSFSLDPSRYRYAGGINSDAHFPNGFLLWILPPLFPENGVNEAGSVRVV